MRTFRNIFEERRQSRLRAHAKRNSRSAEEDVEFLERARAAQARYRESCREELAFKACEYRYWSAACLKKQADSVGRKKKAAQRERDRDAELVAEFELMLAEGDDDATFEEAAWRLYEKTGRRYKL